MPFVFAQQVDRSLARLRAEAAAAAGVAPSGPGETSLADALGLRVEVEALEETFSGSISLARAQGGPTAGPMATRGGKPVAVSGMRARQPSGRASGTATSAGAASPSLAALARDGRSLLEVIRAANRTLEAQAEGSVEVHLGEVAARLQVLGAQLPSTGGSGAPQLELLDQLRRLELQPVTAERLRVTGLGQAVNALRKCGSAPVSALARQLVGRWKAMVTREAAAASASSANAAQQAMRAVQEMRRAQTGVLSRSLSRRAAALATSAALGDPSQLAAELEAAVLEATGGGGAQDLDGLKARSRPAACRPLRPLPALAALLPGVSRPAAHHPLQPGGPAAGVPGGEAPEGPAAAGPGRGRGRAGPGPR